MNFKKLLLIFIPVAVVFAGGILFVSAKNFLSEFPGCPCINIQTATGVFEPEEKTAFFNNRQLRPFLSELPMVAQEEQKVLGDQTGEEKWIEVDLSEQKLKAWEGNNLFLETLVSTGKWTRTPTGEFRIWTKFKYAKMSGGSKALRTYYYLPNVPYIMYFKGGFGLHGTYWHNNFGSPMSHGCVNLPIPIAEKLYYWTTPVVSQGQNSVRSTDDNPGTRIVIHD